MAQRASSSSGRRQPQTASGANLIRLPFALDPPQFRAAAALTPAEYPFVSQTARHSGSRKHPSDIIVVVPISNGSESTQRVYERAMVSMSNDLVRDSASASKSASSPSSVI
jgi:hypothetical protein